MKKHIEDIKPYSPVRSLDRTSYGRCEARFPIGIVSEVVGMSPTFIRKIVGDTDFVDANQVLSLIDQDSFGETFVPRSRILDYLTSTDSSSRATLDISKDVTLTRGDAHALIDRLPKERINCVVTSPPYWGTRIYDHTHPVSWSDGEACPYGHEQTPEGYVRHTVEILWKLKRALADDGSIWWNVMDTFNTRTQIRSNAVEALRAMQGKDHSSWGDYECRRYSAGHAFLKDGEQCGIPARIAERASRAGLYVKSA